MVIAIEGLPGAGKTTTAKLLAKRLATLAVCETTHDHPFIATVYDEPGRYDLQVELGFLLLHNAGYRDLDRDSRIVTDFSPVKDLVFAALMLKGEDLTVFEDLYARLYEGHSPPETVMFLAASPELCHQRVQDRMERDPTRGFEAGMTVQQLERIQNAYESRMEELGDTVLRYEVDEDSTEAQVANGAAELIRSRAAGETPKI